MSDITALPVPKSPNTSLDQPRSSRITRKVAAAIDAMVWAGLIRGEAAKKAGLTEHALYCALRKPHVKAAYLAQCEVLRVSGRAKRLWRLEELAAQDENRNAAVAAIKVAEQIVDVDAERDGRRFAPGFVVIIGPPPPGFTPPRMVEVTEAPTIEHTAAP